MLFSHKYPRMSGEKVLVLCATGKMGRNISVALKADGFDVYGTTRSAKSGSSIEKKGIKPVVCNYVDKKSLEDALRTTGCKRVVIITDFFLAAKQKVKTEAAQGKMMVDVCKAADCEHVIFMSVGDCHLFDSKTYHVHAKLEVEKYLLASGIKNVSILRPVAFFENFDDNANWNPLTKGSVKFLSECKVKYVATYDLGKAAAVMFKNPAEWTGKTLECTSWEGTIHDVAAALQEVSGTPTKGSLAMPICARALFLGDLNHMCNMWEDGYKGSNANISTFKQVVPDAMTAQDWFKFHAHYHNGEKICK